MGGRGGSFLGSLNQLSRNRPAYQGFNKPGDLISGQATMGGGVF